MEPGGSMPHSQGLSNNAYPEPNQPNYPHWYLSLQGPTKHAHKTNSTHAYSQIDT